MRHFLFLLLLASVQLAFSQNVGIGTNTPQTPLHVLVANAMATLRVETNGPGMAAEIELKTTNTIYDQLEIRKWATGASGTIAGINLSGLSMVTTGAAAQGGLLLGNIPAQPIYFTTNNTERMRITNIGTVGIGMASPDYGLHVGGITGEASVGIQNDINSRQSLLSLGYGPRINGNGLTLIKYGPAAAGTTFGLARANLAAMVSDAGSGPLVVGTVNSSPLLLGTNNAVRLHISADGNTSLNVDPTDFAKLHVKRSAGVSYVPVDLVGAVYGENGSTTDGSGVYGSTGAPKTGNKGYAGVTGKNHSGGTDKFGVVGISLGTSAGAAASAGVGGYGDNGVLGYSQSATGAGVLAQHQNGKTALEVNNGFIKVSGTNKTAFKHNTSAANVIGNYTILTYDSPSQNDILLVTHNYSPNATYLNKAVGVFWTGSAWAIYNEDVAPMPQNITFNVLVIKQ